MAFGITARRHGQRYPRQHHPQRTCQQQKRAGALDRARHLRLSLLDTDEFLAFRDQRLDPRPPARQRRGLAREQVGILHPAPRLDHATGGNVRDIHRDSRPERDKAASAIGLLVQDRGKHQLGGAEPEPVTDR